MLSTFTHFIQKLLKPFYIMMLDNFLQFLLWEKVFSLLVLGIYCHFVKEKKMEFYLSLSREETADIVRLLKICTKLTRSPSSNFMTLKYFATKQLLYHPPSSGFVEQKKFKSKIKTSDKKLAWEIENALTYLLWTLKVKIE